MRKRMLRRGGLLAVAATVALLVGVAPAQAATGDSSAYAAKVDVKLLGAALVNVGPLAESKSSGPNDASVVNIAVPGVLSTGVVTSHAVTNSAWAEVAGAKVPLLSAIGKVSADVIKSSCTATANGITGTSTLVNAKLGSLGDVSAKTGVNNKIAIDLPTIGNVATVILNEQIHNPNGSLTVNAIHIKLLGSGLLGTIGSGDVVIASSTCAPVALPVPMASGVGLWAGLGLLGVAGVVVVQRRRKSLSA